MQSTNDWRHLRVPLSDGRVLGYAECGEPDGIPLFYFHGGLSSRLDIAYAASTCKDKGIRLIAPDRPGIGTSENKPGRSLLDWPADVAYLAQQLGLTKFSVLGWSLGGPYSLACAYSIPHMIHRAGTVGCIAPLSWAGSLSGLGLLADRLLIACTRVAPYLVPAMLHLSKMLPARTVKECLLKELKSPADVEIVKALSVSDATDFFREALRPGVEGTVDDYRTISFDWPFSIEKIQAPVNLWHGEEDTIVPISHGRYLQEHIPAAKLTVVPNEGHFLLHRHISDVLQALV